MSKRRLKGRDLITTYLQELSNGSSKSQYSDLNVNPFILYQLSKYCSSSKYTTFLEFGARAGQLGKVLEEKRDDIKYIGVEPFPTSNEIIPLFHITCEEFLAINWGAKILKNVNVIIFADVLEHLQNPWVYLKQLYQAVPIGCRIVISIPNFFHHSSLSLISQGRFDYEEWGVLDFTHLRFFGLENILELLSETGWIVINDSIQSAIDPEGQELIDSYKKQEFNEWNINNLSWRIKEKKDVVTLASYQYILTAQKLAN